MYVTLFQNSGTSQNFHCGEGERGEGRKAVFNSL